MFPICFTNTGNTISEGEARANAKLIAAAPELLEACKQVYALLNHPAEDFSHGKDRACELLAHAIATAEGEQ